jgi:DNA (cytosine-5)-methyltransferase 1
LTGGLDLGLDRAGLQCVAQCEIDDYAIRILTKHWPDVPKFRDVRTIGRHNLPAADLICGGFPCQPHSLAGKRNASADERDLWGEFARLIREIKPRYVLAENVPGLLSSEGGRFFGRVLRDLAESGYDAEWEVIPACAVGATHTRERVFIVAYPSGRHDSRRVLHRSNLIPSLPRKKANPHHTGFSRSKDVASFITTEPSIQPDALHLRRVLNGIPRRMERLRGLGNAVVPQVAQWVGELIVAHYEASL